MIYRKKFLININTRKKFLIMIQIRSSFNIDINTRRDSKNMNKWINKFVTSKIPKILVRSCSDHFPIYYEAVAMYA